MATAEHLLLDKTWFDDGRLFASWRPPARRLLHQTRCNLHRELHRSLHRSCVHLKGHGGVKGALRRIMRQQPSHHYVARFDVARYYESIDHEVLLKILRQRGASAASAAVVADYLRLPDRKRSGCGMTAGGSLSPLLAAVMLIPLDEAMNRLWRRYGLFYVRYMDDFVVMAPTRHKLRRAIKEVHAVMGDLGLGLHATKRCIGQLSNGFDFLGYRVVPGRRLRTSAEGRRRFAEKFRRLYEQGADHHRLWRYAERWCRWRRAGLRGLVSLKGGLKRVVIQQLRALGIVGFPIPIYDAQIGTWQTQKTSASG
jgi:hypothetical protein